MENSSSRDRRGTALLVANFAPDVGFAWWLMERFWIELADLARARGLEPLLLYPETGAIPQSIQAAGIETRFQAFPGRGLRRIVSLLALAWRRRVRMVYLTDRLFTDPVYAALHLVGTRMIINHDHSPGDRPPVGGLKGWVKTVINRMPFICCDLQLCVSPLIRQRAILNARIPPTKAVVVQNGIDPFDCGSDEEYARRVFAFPESHRICVTVGRASPYKRIDFIIDVAEAYRAEPGPDDLSFLFCGDGPDMKRLQARVEAKGLGNRFIFAGRRDDVRKILCSSDFALHAARGEAFSLAILEYMSAGLAVFVPDIPSVCQAVRHGETGMVYPRDDPREVARWLRDLSRDPRRMDTMGRRAAQAVQKGFSSRQMLDQFRSILGKALDRT